MFLMSTVGARKIMFRFKGKDIWCCLPFFLKCRIFRFCRVLGDSLCPELTRTPRNFTDLLAGQKKDFSFLRESPFISFTIFLIMLACFWQSLSGPVRPTRKWLAYRT